jgi:hypothetical protein
MADSILSRASDFAFEQLERSNNDLIALSEPLLTLIVVESAQGVIDNGGLTYFFEENFPGTPPYTTFSEAFRRIGAHAAADCLEQAIALLPAASLFDANARKNYMKERPELFERFDEELCGNQNIRKCLEEYVAGNHHAFQKDKPG